MLKNAILLLAITLTLLACGCKSQQQLEHERELMKMTCEQNNATMTKLMEYSQESKAQSKASVKPNHFLEGAELVGGGLLIEWKVPAEGTCYYTWNSKIIQTKSVDLGEYFEINISPDETENIISAKNMFGIEPDEPIIAELWFKPKQQ